MEVLFYIMLYCIFYNNLQKVIIVCLKRDIISIRLLKERSSCILLAGTHKVIAKNIIKSLDVNTKYLINDKNFIRGNLKPDNFSSYKFKKHYKDESFNMIVSKIHFLASLSEQKIVNEYGRNKFNQELGVVCHFVSDYFCLAHEERWEFKRKFKTHVHYEMVLGRISKEYKYDSSCRNDDLDLCYVANFINSNLNEYVKLKGFESDIIFAQYVCNSIVQAVLKSVAKNTSENLMII